MTKFYSMKNIFYTLKKQIFFNCLKKNLDVFFLPDVAILHSQGSSSVEDVKIENLRTWHYSWSQFYFYKKNFGTYYAYSKCFPFFFKDIIMLIAYTLTFKSKLFKFRFYRIEWFLKLINWIEILETY